MYHAKSQQMLSNDTFDEQVQTMLFSFQRQFLYDQALDNSGNRQKPRTEPINEHRIKNIKH